VPMVVSEEGRRREKERGGKKVRDRGTF